MDDPPSAPAEPMADDGNRAWRWRLYAGTLATIIIGSMRLAVLKWKLSGHRSNLVKDGRTVLDGILKMVETK